MRGNLRLLLSGPKSSAGRPMPDGRTPAPGGWNRIHFIVEDIAADVCAVSGPDLPFGAARESSAAGIVAIVAPLKRSYDRRLQAAAQERSAV